MKLPFIIAYDICDEKRLKTIAKFMERNTIRIQFSIYFICCDRKEIKRIIDNLMKLMDEEDDIRIYRVDMEKSLFLQASKNVKKLII